MTINATVYDRDDVKRSMANADTRAERDGEPYAVYISEDGLRLFTINDDNGDRPPGLVLIYSTADGRLY